MGAKRIQRAHGEDLPGVNRMGRNAYNDQGGGPEAVSTESRGPRPDPRVGGEVAHEGTNGAPTIYRETRGGRRFGKGQRIS